MVSLYANYGINDLKGFRYFHCLVRHFTEINTLSTNIYVAGAKAKLGTFATSYIVTVMPQITSECSSVVEAICSVVLITVKKSIR
jgi:hypothetical protein